MMTTPKAHHWVTRLFHWSTAVLLIYGIVRNAEVTGALFDEQLVLREVAFSMTIGVLFLCPIHLDQIFCRWIADYRPPRLRGSAVASRAVHSPTHALVAFMVITGVMIAYKVLGTSGLIGGGKGSDQRSIPRRSFDGAYQRVRSC